MNTAGYFTSAQSIGVEASTASDNPDVTAVMGRNFGAGFGVAGHGGGTAGDYGESENSFGVFGQSIGEAGVMGSDAYRLAGGSWAGGAPTLRGYPVYPPLVLNRSP